MFLGYCDLGEYMGRFLSINKDAESWQEWHLFFGQWSEIKVMQSCQKSETQIIIYEPHSVVHTWYSMALINGNYFPPIMWSLLILLPARFAWWLHRKKTKACASLFPSCLRKNQIIFTSGYFRYSCKLQVNQVEHNNIL